MNRFTYLLINPSHNNILFVTTLFIHVSVKDNKGTACVVTLINYYNQELFASGFKCCFTIAGIVLCSEKQENKIG
ncbi:hypothetical protein BV926_19165 [Pectobacterium odoriferum]|uniref:Uncharacterized protein n=1 Tax=Pectobacterium odoriferum TaxID=78398 RepID=A0ABD6VK07_9GAMM|nr:hypothetical protein BV926_19165 [Pectobacterium odoriferum]POE27320.1 hypothetical protein BV919_21195 [Pectobacterium odoriferum]